MANFSNIGLQEPSTITNRVAAVTISRGSTAEQQEIMVLGDAESSNGLARILNVAPVSSDWGLVVRPVGASTTVNVSSVAGVVNVAQNSTVWATQSAQAGAWTVSVSGYSTTANVSSVAGKVQVVNSSAADLNVTVAGYSTTVNISSLAGKVQVVNSSAADLNVTVAGYSTIAAISSVAGIVAVRPSDTNWASSAGFHFDGSGNLNVAGTFTASTTVNVSSLAGRVAIAGYHQSGALVNVTDSTNNAINVNVVAGSAAGSTIATISRVQDSSNVGIAVGDSVNNAIRVNVVAGAAGGSTTVNVSSLAGDVRVVNSSAADLLATVSQASTVWAVQLSNYSTTINVSSVAGKVAVVNSSAADLQVTAGQASTVWAVQAAQAGSWTVAVSNPASTTVNVSSLAGRVLTDQNSSVWVTQARLFDGASVALESSTKIPSSNANGLIVRPAITIPATYSASTTGQSSATTFFTSNATHRPYVFAYSVISTLAGPVNWSIQKGSTRLWGGVLAAVSSAVSGANLAVSPPGFLFAGSTGRPLSFNVETSNAGLNVSIAYWLCP